MKLKRLIFLFAIAISFNMVFSQIVGGSHPTQSLPTEVKAGEVTKGGFDSDVSLFTGAMSSSYDLGSVKTLSGLNFNLRLNYSGSKVVGNTLPIATGIPYGEGWNLNLPTISVQVNAYQNYTEAQVISGLASYSGVSPQDMAFNKKQAAMEGALQYLAPTINIPGVISERFVLKNYDAGAGEAIFVPHKFDKLVEARLRGSMWYVTLENGDSYKFSVVAMNYRNPNNSKLNPDSLKLDTLRFKNSILPKGDVLTWYCGSIYNHNHAQHQQINFIYNGYGTFDYYKEFQQPKMLPFYADAIGEMGMAPFIVVKDLLLESITSSSDFGDIEKIELNYKTFSPSSSVNLLKIGDSNVFRKDSLYNFSPVYDAGWDTTKQRMLNIMGDAKVPSSYNGSSYSSFSSWRKYHHVYQDPSILSGGVNSNGIDLNFANSYNPYLFNGTSYPYYHYSTASGSELPFDHSFIESPQLSLSSINSVPGDMYELRTVIHNTNGTTDPAFLACNYDISVVSGAGSEILATGSNNIKDADYVTGARGLPIYNTFANPVKWTSFGKNNDGSTGFTTPEPAYISTSNLFTMPQLPYNSSGIYLQVGPANSDHQMNMQMEVNPPTGSFTNNSYRAYSYFKYKNSTNNSEKYPVQNPYMRPAANFGLGLPWYMMTNVFGKRFGYGLDTNHNCFANPINRMWFATHGSSGWTNSPTAANSNVNLASLQLIRHSKNTYMLTNVKKYVSNGYPLVDKNNGYVLLDSITFNYQNIIDTLYDVNQFLPFTTFITVPNDTVLNCTSYGPSSTTGFNKIGTKNFHKNGYQNVILLTGITKNATNAVTRNGSFSPSATPALTTYFEYDKVKTDSLFFNDPYGVMQGQFTGHFHNLSQITDHLGGTTEYKYYPINSVNADWKNLYGFGNYKADNGVNYKSARPIAYSATPMVKEKILHNSSTDSIPTKVWQYVYDPCKYIITKTATLPAYYIEERKDSEFGYKTTKVKYPKLTVNETKSAYDVYTHYTSESNNLLFSKLKMVQSYDANGFLLKKQEYNYQADTAYLNWYYTRKQFTYIQDVAASNYFGWSDYQLPSYSIPSWTPLFWMNFYDVNMTFLELTKPQYFTDTCGIKQYLNSHFVKLTKETTTNYDYKPIKKKNGPSGGVSFGTAPEPPSGGERQIASNANMTPLETSGYRSIGGSVFNPGDIITITRYTADSISNTSEFTYWDANPYGRTNCAGFRILKEDNYTTYNNRLQYEPSWQLYKKKSYSTEHAGAYTTQEHFYYYDLIQNLNQNATYLTRPDSMHGVFLCQAYRIRNLPYQTRTILKNNNKPAVINSEYYWYDAATKREQCGLPIDTLYISKSPCSIYSNGLDSAAAADSSHITTVADGCYGPNIKCRRMGFSPLGGRMNVPESGGTGPGPDPLDPDAGWVTCTTECDGYTIHWLCPPSGTGDMSTGRYIMFCGERNLLKLKNIYHQSDTVIANTDTYVYRVTTNPVSVEINYTNDYTQHVFKEKIARFKYYNFYTTALPPNQQHQNIYLFALPYKTYTPLTNHNFNEMGLVRKTEDQRGLIKEMLYDTAKAIVVKNTICPAWSWLTFNSLPHKYGMPSYIRIYDKNQPYSNEQDYSFKFNPDLSVDSIKDNNNKNLKYTYDAFGRVKVTMVNGDTTSYLSYSNWDGTNTSFGTRASQNYVETSLFNNKSSPIVETSRAYVDRLGRKYDVAVYADPNFYNSGISDTIMIHSGTTAYDNWDRVIRQYKPFVYRNTTPNTYVSFSPRFNSGVFSQQMYEPNQRGNVIRASKYGEDINTGHKILSTYNIVNGQDMGQDLNNGNVMMQIAQSSSQLTWKQYKFLKTAVMDEDGKKVVTYTDALGKKVAVKTYIDATNSAVTYYVYGSHFKPVEIYNPKSQKTVYSYDYNGNVVYSTSVDSDTMRYFAYKPWGDAGGSQSAVQRKGSLPTKYCTLYDYDAFGRVKSETTTDSSYTYDIIEHEIGNELPIYTRSFGAKATAYFNHGHVLTNVAGRISMSSRNGVPTGIGTAPYSAIFYSYNDKGQLEREITSTRLTTTSPTVEVFSVVHYTKYNLRNSVTEKQIDVNGDSLIDRIIKYDYDPYNRLKSVVFDSDTVAIYTYNNDNGQIKRVRTPNPLCPSLNLDTTSYTYDIRDRLTRINSLTFFENLYYDNRHPQITSNPSDTAFLVQASSNYNGNINAIKYGSNSFMVSNFSAWISIFDGSSDYYGYKYDGINRLTNADASIMINLTNPGVYSAARQCGDENYTHDKVGNTLSLKRGVFSTASQSNYTTLLNYHYVTGKNQLLYIDSAATMLQNFTYGNSGSQAKEKNRNLVTKNNYLPTTNTLPASDFIPNGLFNGTDSLGNSIDYIYNARNERIFVNSVNSTGASRPFIMQRYYLRDASGLNIADNENTGQLYNSNTWNYNIYGRDLIAVKDSNDYYFFDKDHLGNIRSKFRPIMSGFICGAIEIMELNEYTPYGHILKQYVNPVELRYGYQGSEKQIFGGEDNYYTHFRGLNADIGRWKQVDPKANEFESPYSSMGNNPILHTDPLGDICDGGGDDPLAGYKKMANINTGIANFGVGVGKGAWAAGRDMFHFGVGLFTGDSWKGMGAAVSTYVDQQLHPLQNYNPGLWKSQLSSLKNMSAEQWGFGVGYGLGSIVGTKGISAGIGGLKSVASSVVASSLSEGAAIEGSMGAATKGFSRNLWTLSDEFASKTATNKTWGKFYKSASDGTWWSNDIYKHGGSYFKVFEETPKGLKWVKDANKYGDYIINKHKGASGTFIPWSSLNVH